MGPNTTIKIINILKIPKRGSFRSDLDKSVAQDPFKILYLLSILEQKRMRDFYLVAMNKEKILPAESR